ncbi:Alpha/Beta hydrolase protein [Aspergillus cavernicola]|uniref:Alpha/Beta hydrolase protein n=1 Tax=Aspergillus cavernicola TaxID=176166 RepID=A0ABR4IG12_9EURO
MIWLLDLKTSTTMATTPTFTLDHPQLGSLAGRLINRQHADGQPVTEPVVHFRSIPYATIPARFSQSVLLTHIPDHFDHRPHADFTQYGAACPQVPQPSGRGSAAGGFVPGEETITYDEQACLNLTISAPVKNIPPKNPLPVLVYVHGGGFIEGKGHVSALHDTTKMAALAAHEAMDVVIVSIGYRVNWQGFIACSDLLDEAREKGEPAFNYGLRDQRNAFLWIRNHIAGFGGDPDNLTAFGESAGAASLFIHACSEVPLFRRVIIQSGSPSVVGSWTLDEYDAYYHCLLSYLGIAGATREERLKSLRETPLSRLLDFIRENNISTMKPFFGPEGEFFPTQPFWATQGEILANCPWLDEIMIGDDSGEGLVLAQPLKDIPASFFIARVRSILGDESAGRVLDGYAIHEGMDEGLFWQHAMVLMGDLIFSEPTHSTAISVARGSCGRGRGRGRQRIYRWQFCLQNPFPGSILSYTTGHHFVELIYLFMTLTARFPMHRVHFLRRQAEEMARGWVRFANGLPPLHEAKPYDLETGSIMVCDMLQGWTVRTRAEDEEISQQDPWGPRRYRQWEILNEELKRAGRTDQGGTGSDNEKIEATRNQLLVELLIPGD